MKSKGVTLHSWALCILLLIVQKTGYVGNNLCLIDADGELVEALQIESLPTQSDGRNRIDVVMPAVEGVFRNVPEGQSECVIVDRSPISTIWSTEFEYLRRGGDWAPIEAVEVPAEVVERGERLEIRWQNVGDTQLRVQVMATIIATGFQTEKYRDLECRRDLVGVISLSTLPDNGDS